MLNMKNVSTMFYFNEIGYDSPYALFIECTWGKENRIYHTYLQTTISKVSELDELIKSCGWENSKLVCVGESIAHHVEVRTLGTETRLFLYDWLRYQCHQAVHDETIGDIVKFKLI